MLRMLATLLPIDAGEARVFGVDVAREPHRVRQLVGVTGQYASAGEDLTATENLWLFGRLQGLRSGKARATARGLLAQFGLVEAADRPILQFSEGMRRRLDLAASLITRPPLIFLDEPTTGLDPRTRGEMWDTIRGPVADGCTIMLTTQYLDEADGVRRVVYLLVFHGQDTGCPIDTDKTNACAFLSDHTRSAPSGGAMPRPAKSALKAATMAAKSARLVSTRARSRCWDSQQQRG